MSFVKYTVSRAINMCEEPEIDSYYETISLILGTTIFYIGFALYWYFSFVSTSNKIYEAISTIFFAFSFVVTILSLAPSSPTYDLARLIVSKLYSKKIEEYEKEVEEGRKYVKEAKDSILASVREMLKTELHVSNIEFIGMVEDKYDEALVLRGNLALKGRNGVVKTEVSIAIAYWNREVCVEVENPPTSFMFKLN